MSRHIVKIDDFGQCIKRMEKITKGKDNLNYKSELIETLKFFKYQRIKWFYYCDNINGNTIRLYDRDFFDTYPNLYIEKKDQTKKAGYVILRGEGLDKRIQNRIISECFPVQKYDEEAQKIKRSSNADERLKFFAKLNKPLASKKIKDSQILSDVHIPEKITDTEKNIERQIRNAGAGFGNSKKNREVEKAAISFVTKQYKSQGWNVKSVEFERKGYDLLCTKENAEEHIEVKGVRGTELIFTVTLGEVRQAREDPGSVICVVTSALSDKPLLSRYTGQKFIEKFELKELAFRASLRRKRNGKRR